MTDPESRPLKALLGAALWLMGGLWFWHATVGNPFNELALVREARTADARLISVSELDGEDNRGDHYEGADGSYSFLVNGRTYHAKHSRPSEARLHQNVQVEYLAHDPSINRVKGDGVQSVWEWTWRKLALGLVFLGFCLAPGIAQGVAVVEELRARKIRP